MITGPHKHSLTRKKRLHAKNAAQKNNHRKTCTHKTKPRAISTGQLHTSPRFHIRPINVVVFNGSQRIPRLKEGFPLRCFQRLSRPCIATRRCGWRHNRHTRGMSIPVLSYWEQTLSSIQTPTADRDQTVSRRSEPNSRTALNGEQPYPWDLLQPQDAMSRHRGAKPPRR